MALLSTDEDIQWGAFLSESKKLFEHRIQIDETLTSTRTEETRRSSNSIETQDGEETRNGDVETANGDVKTSEVDLAEDCRRHVEVNHPELTHLITRTTFAGVLSVSNDLTYTNTHTHTHTHIHSTYTNRHMGTHTRRNKYT